MQSELQSVRETCGRVPDAITVLRRTAPRAPYRRPPSTGFPEINAEATATVGGMRVNLCKQSRQSLLCVCSSTDRFPRQSQNRTSYGQQQFGRWTSGERTSATHRTTQDHRRIPIPERAGVLSAEDREKQARCVSAWVGGGDQASPCHLSSSGLRRPSMVSGIHGREVRRC